MQFDVITLFPDMFTALTASGITRRAVEQKKCELSLWNPRDFTSDNHRTVDDRPYGGGPGMVMKADVWGDAIDSVIAEGPHEAVAPLLVVPTPTGDVFTQARAVELAE